MGVLIVFSFLSYATFGRGLELRGGLKAELDAGPGAEIATDAQPDLKGPVVKSKLIGMKGDPCPKNEHVRYTKIVCGVWTACKCVHSDRCALRWCVDYLKQWKAEFGACMLLGCSEELESEPTNEPTNETLPPMMEPLPPMMEPLPPMMEGESLPPMMEGEALPPMMGGEALPPMMGGEALPPMRR